MAFQACQWPAFEVLARSQLELPQDGMQLLLWRYPTFGQFTAWQLTNDGLLRRVWDRPQDYMMISQPLEGIRRGHLAQPSIKSASSSLTPEQRSKLWRTLSLVQIPLAKPSGIMLDGVAFGIDAPDCFRLTWNCLRVGWEPLQVWMDETLDWLDSLF